MALQFNPFTGKFDYVNSGDVVGPASSTDNAIVRFDGTTGKLIQDITYSTLDDNGQMTLVAGSASSVPFTAKGAASQSGNLFNLQNSSGTTLASFNKDARLQYNSPTSRSAYINQKAINESTSEYYIYSERYNGAEKFYIDTVGNMRLWGTLLVTDRSNSIGTRALYAEKYGASGNVTAVEFGCIAPSSMSGNHIGVYFNSDVRPDASSFTGTLIGAKYYLYFSNNNGTTSTGSLYGSYYTFDDQSTYGTLSNIYMDYKDGMRLIRSTGVVTNFYGSYIKGDGTSHAGTITNQYGLYIGNISLGSTLKYSIYTNAGAVRFGDYVVSNGRRQKITTKAIDYTLLTTDEVVVFTSTATATLPAATATGQTYRIVCRAGTLTIDGNGSDTVKGELTQTLTAGEDLIISDTASGVWE